MKPCITKKQTAAMRAEMVRARREIAAGKSVSIVLRRLYMHGAGLGMVAGMKAAVPK